MLRTASMPDTPDLSGALRARLAGFSGFLQANGFGVGGGDSSRVLLVASQVGILHPQMLRWSLKALLCGRPSEWHRFDALFDAYFLPANKKVFVEGARDTTNYRKPSPYESQDSAQVPGLPRRGAGNHRQPPERYAASREESLESADFRELARAEEVRDIEALMRRLARQMKRVRMRREARSLRGRRFDLPGTIRRSIEHGGVPLSVVWRDRRRIRPRIVVLLDVSRSMSQYSFFYLRLARALSAELSDIYGFIFHTRLTAISEALRDADPCALRKKCTCWPPAGAGAPGSAIVCAISTGTICRAECIRAPQSSSLATATTPGSRRPWQTRCARCEDARVALFGSIQSQP